MSKKVNKKGFTLIEVVLVLAIGGLIFLLAFLAFQNASVNRRDTQRRNDAGKALAEVANAQSDGVVLTTTAGVTTFKNTYVNNFKGPGDVAYNFQFSNNGNNSVVALNNTSNPVRTIYIGTNSACNGNAEFKASPGNTAAIVDLEKSSACRDDE